MPGQRIDTAKHFTHKAGIVSAINSSTLLGQYTLCNNIEDGHQRCKMYEVRSMMYHYDATTAEAIAIPLIRQIYIDVSSIRLQPSIINKVNGKCSEAKRILFLLCEVKELKKQWAVAAQVYKNCRHSRGVTKRVTVNSF